MADNDRFVIFKGICEFPSGYEDECLKYPNCENCADRKGKTRAEYEKIIAESIFEKTVEQNQSYVLRPDVKTQKDFLEAIKKQCKIYAKAVVDRLFGEGL